MTLNFQSRASEVARPGNVMETDWRHFVGEW